MKQFLSPVLIAAVTIAGAAPVLPQKNIKRAENELSTTSRTVATSKARTVFGSAEAYSDGSTSWIRWEMASERSNVGFYVYRLDTDGKKMIGDDLVQGSYFLAGDQPQFGGIYSVRDVDGTHGSAYMIEAIGMDGHRVTSQVISAQYVAYPPSFAADTADNNKSVEIGRIVESNLTLNKELTLEVRANLQAPDANTHRWVIAQEGVKIGIKSEGLYRITSAELQAAGFNTASDPNLWQLYVEGNQQSIIVGPSGSYIEFYAKGIDRIESDKQAYFLIVGDTAGKRIQTRVARPSTGSVVTSSNDVTVRIKERVNYNSNILNGDAENFWGRTVGATPTTFNFTLNGIAADAATARVTVHFQGFSATQHEVQMVLNGTSIGSATGSGVSPFFAVYDVPLSLLVDGTNTLQMVSVFPGPPTDFSFFDRIEVSYARNFEAANDKLSFYTFNNRKLTISGFSSNDVRVFDTTVEGELTELSNLQFASNGSSFAADIPAAARGRRYIAFENNAFLAPASISLNDPTLLSDPTNAADLVIISYKDFIASSEAWATYRRNQGFNVKVVNVEEIYDEFNYGVLSAEPIKSFLQMTYTSWAEAPRYVLLMGDTTTDPRNYRNLGFFAFVPTRMIDTIFSETGSDEYLADFNGDGLAEMAIGRIAARNDATISTVFTKVQNWETNFVDGLNRGFLFAHDRIDGYNFEALNGRLRDQLPAGTPATMVHRDEANAQANLVAAMNAGKYFTNYAGHGTAGAWAASAFFANSTVPQLNNVNNESVYTMLTCLNGYFMLQSGNSLAESLVHATNGGAVAAWSSTGLTTPDVQELMATRFYNRLGAGQIERLGDLILDAKSVIPGGSDVRLSWALLGDPMLKVRNAQAPPPFASDSTTKK
jgi:hypothetical protein